MTQLLPRPGGLYRLPPPRVAESRGPPRRAGGSRGRRRKAGFIAEGRGERGRARPHTAPLRGSPRHWPGSAAVTPRGDTRGHPSPPAPVLSPLPRGLQHGRAPGAHPSLHKSPLPAPGVPQGSCFNHPPLQSSHDAADMENQNRGAGAAASAPSSTRTCPPFLLCLQRHRHRPAQAQGTATPPAPGTAWAGRPLQPAGLGTRLEPPLSKT